MEIDQVQIYQLVAGLNTRQFMTLLKMKSLKQNSKNSAQRSTTEFLLLGRKLSARRSTRTFAKPSTGTIVMRNTETSKSPTKKMFVLIRTLQSATNIGNVTIQIYLFQIVTT